MKNNWVYIHTFAFERLSLALLLGSHTWLVLWSPVYFNPLKTNSRLFYLKTQFVPRCYKNQSVYFVSGTSRRLFWDK